MSSRLWLNVKAVASDARTAIIGASVLGLLSWYTDHQWLPLRIREIWSLLLELQTPLWATIALLGICLLYTRSTFARLQAAQHQYPRKPLPPLTEHIPTTGIRVYVREDDAGPEQAWHCKHCADSESKLSTLQMTRASAAGKEYACHACKFKFMIRGITQSPAP